VITISNIQVSESSPTEPVSLIEAKAWLQIDFSDHDDLLTSMITGAREDIEQELNLKLVAATASFYADTTKNGEEVTVFPYAFSMANVSGVTVKLLEDGETDLTQIEDSDYYLNGTLKINGVQRSKVEYTITPVVPTAIKEAIKMLVAYRYNNRGDQEKQMGLPEDIERKVSKYRAIWL
jgi:uncharacterized phiE125 gp8 family phage protein